jgi:hypothetical protein
LNSSAGDHLAQNGLWGAQLEQHNSEFAGEPELAVFTTSPPLTVGLKYTHYM